MGGYFHLISWAVCLSIQSCLTLCDPMDYSPPGSSVHGIFQARILEWVAMASSRGIFPTQGLNPGLLHSRQILYQLSYQGSPSLGCWSRNYQTHGFSQVLGSARILRLLQFLPRARRRHSLVPSTSLTSQSPVKPGNSFAAFSPKH